MSINRIIVSGRLATDPRSRTTPNGKDVADFRIAVRRRFVRDGGADADFMTVTAWGKTAQFVGNYLSKGRMVAVDGRLELDTYTDREGNERMSVNIVADNIQNLDYQDDNNRSGGGGGGRDDDYSPAQPAASGGGGGGADATADDAHDPFADDM